jgi:hypothetical protein
MKFVGEVQWDFLDFDNNNNMHQVENVIEWECQDFCV